ncbi:hypothetical protein NNJEOMEG_00040 [Fundidesulfovibrio magnetotacticus]|uniref:Putative DnaT-like domain-containing protein n=1 Tax=Fundidesulfovibrio magnetotacticus TaxID=2730080 RepID=A0A6V8LPH3_9BACT|nr:DnaT-like ssDNA-binding protein [Fundidesulfovibrio magnetotacticus]GFK92218.1 hypothetical protein NNJEOMEG_00040 [Fundidesulfovibrio magnetotacticus]
MAVTKGTNSYVSLEEATEYMEARPHAEAWVGADDEAREKALLHACRLMDLTLVWRGVQAVQGQPLAWPRAGLTGMGVDSTSVPVSVRLAQVELALVVLGSDPMTTPDTSGVRREKVGPIEVEYRGSGVMKVIPEPVFAFVAAYARRAAGLSTLELLR